MLNETNLEYYNLVMDGIKDYHKTVLPDVKINNHILTAPLRVQVNKDNIGFPLECILKSFQRSTKDDNPYHQLLRTSTG